MISMRMIKHSQIFQNSKSAMSLKYIKKKIVMKLIFREGKFGHLGIKIFLQGDTIIDEHDQAFSKY